MTEFAAFTGVHVVDLAGTAEVDKYDQSQRERCEAYVASIVVPEILEATLADDFLHVDGALALGEGDPEVRNVSATPGKDLFIHIFRAMVGRQSDAAGEIQGVWIPRRVYAPIGLQVARLMPDGPQIEGDLLGVLAAEFPYVLGREPLGLPPNMRQPGEEPFAPLVATGNPALDGFKVRVTQAIYGTPDKITARVGLVWDDPASRAVPLAINAEVLANRAGTPLQLPTAAEVVQRLTEYAQAA